jgi:transketolase
LPVTNRARRPRKIRLTGLSRPYKPHFHAYLNINSAAATTREKPLTELASAGRPRPADRAAAIAAATGPNRARLLAKTAAEVRALVLRTIGKAGMGHVGGDLSVSDILTTLFFGVLRLDPSEPLRPGRDRFILSKGHCAVALYSTLALRGFIPEELLGDFAAPLSPLNGHPNRRKVPGVEANTGPLGHGLPIGVGCAIAARLQGADWRTFVVLGDGELQEGSNWEAAMAAGHYGLDNLVALVDNNRMQADGATAEVMTVEPVDEKFAAFGFAARRVDANSIEAVLDAFARARTTLGRPTALVCDTLPGKGVPSFEVYEKVHYIRAAREVWERALEELG